jgi:hypothetical protein
VVHVLGHLLQHPPQHNTAQHSTGPVSMGRDTYASRKLQPAKQASALPSLLLFLYSKRGVMRTCTRHKRNKRCLLSITCLSTMNIS